MMVNSNGGDEMKKDRAKARWSILRNALLQKAQSSNEHSIHRFAGYQLLEPTTASEGTTNEGYKILEGALKLHAFDDQLSLDKNLDRLEFKVYALAAFHPNGKCLDIAKVPSSVSTELIGKLKERCQSVVHLLVVDDKNPPEKITILVQESSKTLTKYTCRQYKLDESCSLFTREPFETKLSIQDLVSHRTTGVDNTGNICVWDSERTLSFLLYHHLDAFLSLFKNCNGIRSARRILELGTGMAGLAAIALGLRLVQDNSEASSSTRIDVTLTDGHAEGVKNNDVNQVLTKAFCSENSKHPYHSLSIETNCLLWTTELESSLPEQQDVVLISDCVHFQNFHAALVATTLRSLCVGGIALFCQPKRGDSLDNFVSLLACVGDNDLVSIKWIQHSAIEEAHENASSQHNDVYDENLHYPKLLAVTKLRDLTIEDCQRFEDHQKSRN
ncbi:unnamed protein product [Cylindrotheca closterium]|uniref:Calmodulin-lysine N-methyltransferase n=1 Tax=Cylindrotheca closterium TaxID=2856 RepID=A0AAD2PYB0_9STRA|nr:unnamed protein product [Cylindrotheca closterium]